MVSGLLFFLWAIIGISMLLLTSIILDKINENKVRDELKKDYDAFVSNGDRMNVMITSKLIAKLGNMGTPDNEYWSKLFDNAHNPWGMTPRVMRGLRALAVIVFSILLGVFLFLGMGKEWIIVLGLFLATSIFYPTYYYKAIAKEREDEWNKVYEFIWLIKYTSTIYDAKKVCLEVSRYIKENNPEYEELIRGFYEFHIYWDDTKIPEIITRFYNFSIPKEVYSILWNMQNTGTDADQNLENIRNYALNKHDSKVQNTLSTVESKATVASLPFLLLSVIIALIVPMIAGIMQYL